MTKIIKVNLKKIVDCSYDIRIGITLKDTIRDILKTFPHSQRFVITDQNVSKYYLRLFDINHFKVIIVAAGEVSKSRKTREYLENKLLAQHIDRNSIVIALGGGVVGDLVGFMAATLLRGIPFIQIPTSLLAQVDSSIGGKVGINHLLGKNLIGSFYQPICVYIDVNTLKTLPLREFRNGMAEVIKYAVILDWELFKYLEKYSNTILEKKTNAIIHLIQRCCELKKSIIQIDERESGQRRILNFGHTIGHSLEILSNYKILHGEAVAIGMIVEAKISVLMGLLSDDEFERVTNLLKLYGLTTNLPHRFSIKQIVRSTLYDKKMQHGEVQYTLLKEIGKAVVGIALSEKQVLNILSV